MLLVGVALLVLAPGRLFINLLLPAVLRDIRLYQVQCLRPLFPFCPSRDLVLDHFNVFLSVQKAPLLVKGVLGQNSLHLTVLIHVQGVLEHRICALILATLAELVIVDENWILVLLLIFRGDDPLAGNLWN